MQLLAIFHVGLAAWFTAIWCRAIGIGWLSGLVGGLTFSLSYMLSQIYWPSWLESTTWIPLALFAIERHVSNRSPINIVVLAISISMLFLSGGNQAALYGLIVIGLYVVFAVFRANSLREGVMLSAGMFGALLLGLSLAAPQLLSTIEASQLSARPTHDLTRAQLLPFDVMFHELGALFQFLITPPDNPKTGYIGAVALALAALGILSPHRHIFAFAVVLATWAILNVLTPLWFIELLLNLPILSWFRIPFRAVVMLHIAIAVAAALGTSVLIAGPSIRQQWLQLCIIFCVLGACALLRYPGQL
jgi:hypothetical protein